MKTRKVDGKLMRCFKVSEEAVSSEEHFKHAIEEIIRDYAMILDVEEMKQFVNEQIDSHF